MPYNRRTRRFAPLQSDKHEITWSNLAQNASSSVFVQLSTAVQPASKNTAPEVGIGSKIKGFYIEMHFSAETITNPKVIHWIIIRRPQNLSPTAITPTLYYQAGRKFIIKRGMEMLPKDTSTVYKRAFFVKIPPVYQRQGETDTFNLVYQATSAETINACGFCIYKELY